MAGDWIKMSCNLDTNPRVMALADSLGVDELFAIGMLWKVWAWADQHTLDGHGVTVTTVRIDKLVHRDGFAAALRNIGWLEGRDGALTFPRFAEHNGQTAKDRGLAVKRKQAERSRSNRDISVTREEKRREEIPEYVGSSARAPADFDDEVSSAQVEAWRNIVMSTTEEADAWISSRRSTGWMVRGTKRKPGPDDLKSFTLSYRQNQADRASKPSYAPRGVVQSSGDYTL